LRFGRRGARELARGCGEQLAASGAAVGVQERGLARHVVEVTGDDFEQCIFLEAPHVGQDANSCETHLI